MYFHSAIWQLSKEDRPGPQGRARRHPLRHVKPLDELLGESGACRRVVGLWCHATGSAYRTPGPTAPHSNIWTKFLNEKYWDMVIVIDVELDLFKNNRFLKFLALQVFSHYCGAQKKACKKMALYVLFKPPPATCQNLTQILHW